MRILVTGSRGFIGGHLLASSHAKSNEILKWAGDVRDLARCNDLVDVVLHLAASSRYDQFNELPHQSYTNNVVGTAAVLNYCGRVGARCVLTSTSAVYCPSECTPRVPEDAPICPRSAYGISKWLSESLCHQQALDRGVVSTVLRLFNVYGPGQHPSFLIPYVVECLKERRPIFLRMAEGFRDFVYIADVVEALFKAALLRSPGVSVFNIGSGRVVRVREVVEVAERVFGQAVAVETTRGHPNEVSAVVADTSRARNELGWAPMYDLESGLIAMRDECKVRE